MTITSNTAFLRDALSDYILDQDSFSENVWNGRILPVSNDPHFKTICQEIIGQFGGRLAESLSLQFSPAEMSQQIQIAAILFHCPYWNEETQGALQQVIQHCKISDTPLIVRTELDVLDMVLAEVGDFGAGYLLEDDPAELIVTLQTQIQRAKPNLFSKRDELDIVDLQKISADVERIARVLAQLSSTPQQTVEREAVKSPFIEQSPFIETGISLEQTAEDKPSSSLSDMPFQFKEQDVSAIRPLGETKPVPSPPIGTITAKQVREMIKARRLRDQYFDSELFADPAWDMLLDLMAARLEGAKVSVSSLCIAASVPPTTALRWIKTMTEEKIFERKADIHDGRRIFIELSDEATAGMVGFFSMIRRSKLMMI